MYNVLITDDQPLYRVGLRTIINQQPNFNVVDELDNATDAFVRITKGGIDVVVMDLTMAPGESGLSVTRRIHDSFPDVQILVNSDREDQETIDTALHNGAAGYVLKNSPLNEFTAALTTVVCNRIFVDQNIVLTPDDFKAINSEKCDAELYYYNALSSREKEVLPLIVMSYSNKEIASKLFITTKTVEAHKANIMRKLDYPSRAALVSYAVKHQLVDF